MLDALHAIAHSFELLVGWMFSADWLPPKDFQFFKWLVVPGYGYGAVLVIFALLELVFPQDKRRWTRSSLLSGTYLFFAGKLGLYAVIVAPAMRHAWLYLGLPSLHLDRSLPLALYMPLAVLVVTFTGYWSHRLMHRVPYLWQIHKVHHAATNLNFSSVYQKHFLELLLDTPFHLIATLLLGTDLVAPFGIIFKLIDVLAHSNVRLNMGRLSYLIATPQAHRVHHSIDPKHYDTNFGNTVMIWDHLFKTFHYDPKEPPTAYGIDEELPTSFVKQQVLPLFSIARLVKQRVSPEARPK